MEIRLVVERGFEGLSKNNMALNDQIIVEMANLHAKEFAYQGIVQKNGRASSRSGEFLHRSIGKSWLPFKKETPHQRHLANL